MPVSTYAVTGMTCGHCATAVSAEVSALAGVTGVTVDVEEGRLTVTADIQPDEASVREAVEEAGYMLVGTS
ncbi:MAG TPA: heavy metal-associated domain-containing protein [Euzebya sp.]|nr:heavy metal-associated domain-containing protein [Euzebya sp.]